jgi:hypothetical protein
MYYYSAETQLQVYSIYRAHLDAVGERPDSGLQQDHSAEMRAADSLQ